MTENKSTKSHDFPESLFEVARKIMLAGIGAASIAQEEFETFINKLIERGEIAEKDGRKLIEELKEKREAKIKEHEERLEKKIEESLLRLGVPTQKDFKELSNKIAALTKKIDQLTKEQK